MVNTEKPDSLNDAITPTTSLAALPARDDCQAPFGPHPELKRTTSAPAVSHRVVTLPQTDQYEQQQQHHLHRPAVLQPSKPVRQAPPWKKSIYSIVTYSYLNVLLVFVPISWAVEFAHQPPTLIFIMSALAVIPLAALLSFATEELALRLGDTLGGLLNCSFGNAVELIISILALVKGEIRVVQAAMIGSILSNCLLVLGCCFFAGGLKYHEQGYRIPVQQLHIGMLGISVMAIVLPAAFYNTFTDIDNGRSEAALDAAAERIILEFSHGVAILLLITYIAFLVFQFHTHSYMYRAAPGSDPYRKQPPEGAVFKLPWRSGSISSGCSDASSVNADARMSTSSTAHHHHHGGARPPSFQEDIEALPSHVQVDHSEHEVQPKLTVPLALGLMLGVTAITGVTCEWLIESLNGIAEDQNVSKEWLALILLPLLGNAVEHVTAVIVSVKGRLELALAVAVGSSIQVALLILPFLVLLGWMIGQPLTLYFDTYEVVTLFISILIVNFAISDGRSNWMEGFLLIMCYVLIALLMWYYDPSSDIFV